MFSCTNKLTLRPRPQRRSNGWRSSWPPARRHGRSLGSRGRRCRRSSTFHLLLPSAKENQFILCEFMILYLFLQLVIVGLLKCQKWRNYSSTNLSNIHHTSEITKTVIFGKPKNLRPIPRQWSSLHRLQRRPRVVYRYRYWCCWC